MPPRKIVMPTEGEPEAEIPVVETRQDLIPPLTSGRKMIFGGIGLLVVIILIIVGMNLMPKGAKKSSQVTINYWGLWEDSSIINSVIAGFEAKNPNIKINYVKNQKDNYRTRLLGRLGKSETEADIPDIFRIHNTWIPMFQNNLAVVPQATATVLDLEKDFFDVYKESLKVNNSYLAIPLMYDGLSLFYNKDLIDAAGVALPKSWWELESVASKLTVKDETGKIKVAGVAMGMVDNVDHWSDIVGLMMKQNGVDPLLDDEASNKKLKDVLDFYTLFKTRDRVWDETLPPSTQLFANGKLAFYFGPSWRVFDITEMNPNLNFEIMTVPQLPTLENVPTNQLSTEAKLTNIHWASYWVEGVNVKSGKQKEAWKFLEYLASKEGLEKMYLAASQTRSFGEIYPRKSMVDQISSNTKIKAFVSVANEATSWYLASRTFDDGLNDEMQKYFGDAINGMVIQNQDSSAVMTNLRNGINQLKQKYQLKSL